MTYASHPDVLWINTGGTLVSEAYNDPYNPPVNVSPLPPKESGELMHAFLSRLNGEGRHVTGYS